MKPSLQLKISQSLTMTPQLQQAIRLLQLSTLELQSEIQQTMEENPMLEHEDDAFDDAAEKDSNQTENLEAKKQEDSSEIGAGNEDPHM
ncbi:MAG: RNA polymerase factor sigma-54, partial [Gammaproteobacteria bacterium]